VLDFNNLPAQDKIYYRDESVVIYCADCRLVLPLFPDKSFDLVLTDPPYMNLGKAIKIPASMTGVYKGINSGLTVSDIWDANLDWLVPTWKLVDKGLMVFCSYHFIADIVVRLSEAIKIALLTWYERNSPNSLRNRPHYQTQYIWALEKNSGLNWRKLKTLYDIPKLAAGCMATERLLSYSGDTLHPTQKPILLMSELLKVGADIILDPFLGSGTTAVAAKILGRKCVGIEISEKYCEIAARRCSQSVMQLDIPTESVEYQE